MLHCDASVNGKVIRQLEYYFGNANLSRDSFLMGEMEKDNGWVDIETMLRFKRLGEIVGGQASIIIDSVQDGASELVELNDVKTKIRRKPNMPLPEFDEHYKRDQNSRSCYVKGFKIDEENGFNFEKIQEYLEAFGSESVHLRPFIRSEAPFRSVFVTFGSLEQAIGFLENKTIVNGVSLEKMTKSDYLKRNPSRKEVKKRSRPNRTGKPAAKDHPPIDQSEILYEFEIDVGPTNHCFSDNE